MLVGGEEKKLNNLLKDKIRLTNQKVVKSWSVKEYILVGHLILQNEMLPNNSETFSCYMKILVPL